MLLLLPDPCLAKEKTAYSNPETPPPLAPEHEASGDDYFEDAVFIGDSMMDDIEMLDLFPTANFVCQVGIGPSTLNYHQFRVKGSEDRLTAFEATERYPHKKIYILLGSNSLDHRPYETCTQEYAEMIDQFIDTFPDSLIYIIAPPPGGEEAMIEMRMPPQRYLNFRNYLLSLAEEKHLYFVDFYSLLINEDGYMHWKYVCSDGQHPHRGGYVLLEEAIRTHTVEYQ